MTIKSASLLLVTALAATCTWALPPADPPALASGIDPVTFDTSVRPGDDFFQYVNGTWIKNNPIPPEYSRWGAHQAPR